MSPETNVIYFDFSDFRLDLKNNNFLIKGEPLSITRKDFQTLALLVKNHGRIVKKEDFFSHLWSDSFVEETNLTRHIYVLRKIFEQSAPGEEFIETVPKRGYRFIALVKEVFADCAENNTFSDSANDLEKLLPTGLNENETEVSDIEIIEKAGYQTKLIERRKFFSSLKSILTTAFLILTVSILAGYIFPLLDAGKISAKTNSVAVLPFKTIGGSDQEEKLGLGMADAVIVRLSQQKEIPIRATSAVFPFTKQTEVNGVKAGKELGVETVLEGTVQRQGEWVRISVQLVNVTTGETIWAESFNQKFTNIFAIQDSISAKVAESLRVNLNRKEEPVSIQRGTSNLEAYQSYLMGIYFWNTRTKAGLEKSIEYFKRAIELDNNYALAYAGLAEAYNMQFVYGYAPRTETVEKIKDAALKALSLDAKAVQAYVALANVQISYERDYREGRKSLETAIELSPFNSTAHHRYAWALLRSKQLDEAVKEMKLAQEYDPLSSATNAALCGMLTFKRDYDQAIEFCNIATEINPDTPTVSNTRAIAYFLKGEQEKAIQELEVFTAKNPQAYRELGSLGYFYAKTGKTENAEKIMEILQRELKENSRFNNDLAMISYALGKREQAFDYLEKSIDSQTFTNLSFFDPTFDEVKADPLFAELLKRKNYRDITD